MWCCAILLWPTCKIDPDIEELTPPPIPPVGCAFYPGILFHRPLGLGFGVYDFGIFILFQRKHVSKPHQQIHENRPWFPWFFRFFRERQQDVKIQVVEIWMYSNDCFGWCILQDLEIFVGVDIGFYRMIFCHPFSRIQEETHFIETTSVRKMCGPVTFSGYLYKNGFLQLLPCIRILESIFISTQLRHFMASFASPWNILDCFQMVDVGLGIMIDHGFLFLFLLVTCPFPGLQLIWDQKARRYLLVFWNWSLWHLL